MLKRTLPALLVGLSAASASAAPITYLSCDLPSSKTDGPGTSHFDFTLDEQNSTVSYNVKNAETYVEKAVFSPQAVTWIRELPSGAVLTRTISRVDLTFTDDYEAVGKAKLHAVGQCSLVKTPSRQF